MVCDSPKMDLPMSTPAALATPTVVHAVGTAPPRVDPGVAVVMVWMIKRLVFVDCGVACSA